MNINLTADSVADISKYQNILRDNGITDRISKVTVSSPDLKGQHMGSVIELVEVEFENEGTQRVPSLHCFVKNRLSMEGFTDPLMKQQMEKLVIYEGTFLKEFVAELKNLCAKRGAGTISANLIDGLFPKTYYYNEYMIIMENLVKKGYANLPKMDKLDFEHAKLVLENLAKLHGTSHVLIESEGGSEKFFENRPDFREPFLKPGMADFFGKLFEPSFALVLQVLKSSNHPEKDEKHKLLQQFQGKLTDTIIKCLTADSVFFVVNHPDCWSNNIMFEGPGPHHEKLVFVDFQMLRAGSPNLDIGYFFFTSIREDARKRWRELLKIYFDTLKTIVESLGQPFEFSFEDFVSDFAVKSKMGFLFGLFTSLGFEAMGGHDAEAGSEFTEDTFTNLILNWITANPVKAIEISEGMISLVNDYLLFGKL